MRKKKQGRIWNASLWQNNGQSALCQGNNGLSGALPDPGHDNRPRSHCATACHAYLHQLFVNLMDPDQLLYRLHAGRGLYRRRAPDAVRHLDLCRVHPQRAAYILAAGMYYIINCSLSSLSRRLEARHAYVRD
jgi:hypothetical protein